MADIRRCLFRSHLRSEAASHIVWFRGGRRIRSGRGLTFWFHARRSSIVKIPLDDRDTGFVFQVRSQDFQAATVQGAVTWRAAIPREWRIAQVRRADLDRFLFAPEDVVVVVGQDGLVANVAKYLAGQPVTGVNAEPDRNPGILVPHSVASAIRMLVAAAEGQAPTEERTMLRAELDTGQTLLALNEVFVGHASHQSVRYMIE